MSQQLQFDRKMKRMSRKHRRLARGAIASVNHDGLIIARPKRASGEFPIKGILLSVAAFFVFKGFLLASEGQITYLERVTELSTEGVIGKIGAFVMQADPLTMWIASYLVRFV